MSSCVGILPTVQEIYVFPIAADHLELVLVEDAAPNSRLSLASAVHKLLP